MQTCKRCGHEFYKLSRNKLCWDCGIELQREAITQMRNKSGPIYDKWLKALEPWMKPKPPHEEK